VVPVVLLLARWSDAVLLVWSLFERQVDTVVAALPVLVTLSVAAQQDKVRVVGARP
jgi:hypothetical protein